eukprot:GHUV01005221.1.p1 GENE.GHUV01005221.1~~GHUV01005221.1.p1  ORF type:complete len:222 (+),score=102.02 GHUV01005221.1:817-1482(+)
MYSALRKMALDDDMKVQYQARAKMLVVKPQEPSLPKRQRLPGTVFVVSAGPEDQVAADQVKVAAEHLGCYVIAKQQFSTRDVGRLMEQATGLQAADVVVVIAGVDSALPGVLSGLVDAPIIAVPTSSAYNNGLQGVSNLVAAVSSCAPGVSVVNIDGTVSAAVMCAKMLRVAAARVEKLQAAAATAAQQQALQGNGHSTGNGKFNNILPGFAPVQVQPAAI